MEQFNLKTSICFGTDALNCLETIRASKIFIVTDPFMVESGMADRITAHLNKKNYMIFSKVVPDPPLELVVEGVREVMAYGPEALIALGGGSAIDEAKAVMHFSRKIGNMPEMEFIAIPTTSGTGSEVTSFAVITDKEKGIKYPLVDQRLLPDIAVLDPTLVKSLPPAVVADTGMDVLTHALEAYVSLKANAFTDALAEWAAVTVLKYLYRSYQSADDFEAKEKMHYASCIAGLAFDRTSLGVNHAIAHNIGGKLKVPHGRTNAVLLPHVLEYNAGLSDYSQKEFTTAAEKYARIAALYGIGGINIRTSVKNLIHQIQKMQKQMNMPRNFQECGITPGDYKQAEEAIAKGAMADNCIAANPRYVTKKDVTDILKHAL